MRLEDELMFLAGITDRVTATFVRTLLPLVEIGPAFALEFLESHYADNLGARLDPFVLRSLEDALTREVLNSIDSLEENSQTLLVGAAEMARESVLRGLSEESFEDPNTEAQRDAGISKIALAFAGAAGVLSFRNMVAVPFQGGPGDSLSWPQWFCRTAAEVSGQARKILRQSVDQGRAVSEIVDALQGAQGKAAQSAFTVTRGAVTDITNRALMATYAAAGVVASVRYVAVLDNKTSQICQGLSGTVWPLGSTDIVAPPRHPNCRSILMPILRGQEDAPPPPSYEQWLKGKPDAMQREILGPTRFSAFKSGLGLSQMATADSALTVGQLKRLFPDIVKGEKT